MSHEPIRPVKPRGFRTPRCEGCGLPNTTCLCQAYPALDLPHRLHIVLSRAEARSTSNTARLLRLWIPQSTQLHVLGKPPPPSAAPEQRVLRPQMQAHRDSRHEVLRSVPVESALLFPSPDATCLDQAGPNQLQLAQQRTVVIVDGTWSQAHKLTRRVLGHIRGPQIQLCAPWPSSYRLRRNARGLCTLEATAIALAHMQAAAQGRELLNRFQHWTVVAERVRTGSAHGARSAPAPDAEPLGHPAVPLLPPAEESPCDTDCANR